MPIELNVPSLTKKQWPLFDEKDFMCIRGLDFINISTRFLCILPRLFSTNMCSNFFGENFGGDSFPMCIY